MRIHGWGRYPILEAEVQMPLSRSGVQAAIQSCAGDATLIARGLGRAYGDSALATHVVSTTGLDCLLSFDRATGVMRCAAGVSLAELLRVFVPQGWFLPVTPGTKFVTVGGAIASDVHGKNHHLSGCFSEFVTTFDLLLADGRIVECSRSVNADLFHATCGGMGLTGIILEASLRLLQISSAYIEQTTYKARNLAEALELFEGRGGSLYSVAWIDCMADGNALGRSLLMTGEHSTDGQLALQSKGSISVPMDPPFNILSRSSIRAFNTLYYHRVLARESRQRVHYEPFFYPLDGIHHWNRLYGKSGFTQYQFVIPRAAGLAGLTAICRRIVQYGRGSFLAVLKALGPQNDNLLSFPLEGYTLALDFKMEPALLGLLQELDAMVTDYAGRVYLAKDVRLGIDAFRRGYPRWEQFQQVRQRYQAQRRFASEQSRRLGLD